MPEGVVAAPSNDFGFRPRKSLTRGSAIVTRRSMNSYMRVLRSVTLAPMGMPSRSLKVEIDLRALVITGFWPAIERQDRPAATVAFLELAVDFADAHVQHDLVDARNFQRVLVPELLDHLGDERHRRSADAGARCSRRRWPPPCRLRPWPRLSRPSPSSELPCRKRPSSGILLGSVLLRGLSHRSNPSSASRSGPCGRLQGL